MSSALAEAWKLVAALLGEGEPPREVDEATLDEVTRAHRMDAALADARLTVPDVLARVSPRVLEHWRGAHAAALTRAISRAAPLRKALAELEPIPVIVLKGAAYAELLYPSPGDRSSGDVDILVPPSDLQRALRRLEGVGYRRLHAGDPTLDAPENHERQLEGPDLDLDLHQGFTQQARLRIDYHAVFERSLAWPSFAANARLLAPEDAVAYHCVHAAGGEFTPDAAPAVGLLDLRQMLRPQANFWGSLGGGPADLVVTVRRASEWGAERMLYATLALAARLFPSLAPAAARAAEPLPGRLRFGLDRWVVDRAFPLPIRAPARLEVLLRKALLLRPLARLRLLRLRLPQILSGGASGNML